MRRKYSSATEKQQAPPLHKTSLQLHHIIKENYVHLREEKKSKLQTEEEQIGYL